MDILHSLLGEDIKAGLLIILNLIVIESLLSVDNAAVLATMVLDLPKEQRSKAPWWPKRLRYQPIKGFQ